ncbi:hypothetical protein DM82_5525 [Burkholderia oklahomensis]|uniref:Lipoprotein n=1 Tax=Burkholderia oklahomensis TaxID=342113 RepID=A0AAI8FQT7_9BURK|nr:hypothetical protein [Burkholderia oklahomensis]AIO69529.1 hypothetical protein DM82_5525 [Burkholderia oklahomensis]AOI39080.1 hypothetical protein WG70_05240 [Burkholderia oklahomensis EO147]
MPVTVAASEFGGRIGENDMKRILILLLCLGTLFAASGCASQQTVANAHVANAHVAYAHVDAPHPAHMGRPNWL